MRPGDLLNVPAGFLNKLWVKKHGMPTSTVVVATVVRVRADGGQAGVSAVIEQYPYVFRIPLKHPCLAKHVRPNLRTLREASGGLQEVLARGFGAVLQFALKTALCYLEGA